MSFVEKLQAARARNNQALLLHHGARVALYRGEILNTPYLSFRINGDAFATELTDNDITALRDALNHFAGVEPRPVDERTCTAHEYTHLRVGEGYATLAIDTVNGVAGVALCSPESNFSRKEGRRIALERLCSAGGYAWQRIKFVTHMPSALRPREWAAGALTAALIGDGPSWARGKSARPYYVCGCLECVS